MGASAAGACKHPRLHSRLAFTGMYFTQQPAGVWAAAIRQYEGSGDDEAGEQEGGLSGSV
eukprot:1154291-Pelagomonas_calceolata.AAC.18